MDDKTAELRDVFLDTTGTETVTERQSEPRGSLVDTVDPERVTARLRDQLDAMRRRYDFRTDLGTAAYLGLVDGFHEGATDAELAERLGVERAAVVRARLDCHLVRESDRAHPDFAAIRDRIVDGADDATVAAALDCDPEAVTHVRRVVTADREATRANERFRGAFADLLTDADLSGRLVGDSREDGLREATEDIETDVSL
jgi:hypothetical protein